MKEFKLKVDCGQVSEIVELTQSLGYRIVRHDPTSYFVAYGDSSSGFTTERVFDGSPECEEITLQQLRDMAVLHRNDMGDATHESLHRVGYLSSDGVEYLFNFCNNKWFISTSMSFASENMVEINPIKKDKDMENLISGKEALIALANGEKVLIRNHHWDNFDDLTQDFSLNVFFMGEYEFKLKPRTIKIGDIEVPAPFEPKEGDVYYYINNFYKSGYDCRFFHSNENHFYHTQAWRTENEIKQVVAAWRKLIGVAK